MVTKACKLKVSFLLAIVAACIILSGFAGGCRDRTGRAPLIGMVLKDNTSSYFQDMERGARKAAKEGNADILVLAPEKRREELETQIASPTPASSETDKQSRILEDLIKMNVDGLCIAPEDPVNCIDAISKATSLRIPVVLMDSDIDRDKAGQKNAEVISIIMGDNFQGGGLAGRYVAEKTARKGVVAIMEGTPKSSVGLSRRNGFLEAMKKYPDIQVVYTKPAYFKRSKSFDIELELIKNYPGLKGVYAFDDMMAIGVSDALIISGEEGKWVIVGFDATEEGRRASKEGRISASIFNNPNQIGGIAVKYALMAIKGEKVPPQNLVKTELITKESLLMPFE